MKDENQRTEQIERILELSDGIFKLLLPTVPREILDLDLTTPQMKVVLLLFLNGPTHMSALASGLGVSLATTTGVVDRLVERSMITREEFKEDRRVVLSPFIRAGACSCESNVDISPISGQRTARSCTSVKASVDRRSIAVTRSH